jgi:hypothetical protein
MNKLLITLMMGLCFSLAVNAKEVIDDYISDAQVVGEGRLTYLFWDVYDASLIAPKGEWKNDKPFALKLTYLRKLEGKKIAERSIQEMRGQGINDEVKLATWHSQMINIFPDVDDGYQLMGIRDQQANTLFYHDNMLIGRIDDAEFTQAFFDIWLSDKTSEPKVRRKLLGQ